MASRHFRRSLAAELPTWLERGWISPQSADALRAEYQLDHPLPSLGPLLRSLFATVLLGAGLILVLGHNWNELPRVLRLFLALLPSLVVLGLGVWRFRREERPSPVWAESLALASSLCVALSISLVAQIYNISGDFPRFVLTWALLTLPAALLLESSCAWILYQVLSTVWLYNAPGAWTLPGYAALLAPSLLLIQLPSVWSRPGLSSRPLALTALLTCLGFSFGKLTISSGLGYVAYASWFATLSLFFWPSTQPAQSRLRLIACLGLSVVLLILSYKYPWTQLHFGFHDRENIPPSYGILCTIILLLGLLGSLILRWRQLDSSGWLWGLSGLFVLLGSLLHEANLKPEALVLLMNLLIVALAVVTMRRGLLHADALRTNLGWLLLSVLILLRFFDSNFGYLTRGIAFIVLGLGFLAVNAWMKKSKSKSHETTPPFVSP